MEMFSKAGACNASASNRPRTASSRARPISAFRARLKLALAALTLSALGLSGAASAASVDLTISQTVPTAVPRNFEPFTYQIVVGNVGAATTAASTLSVTLAADLVSKTEISVVASGGASCPALSTLATALGTVPQAGGNFTLPIASLPTNGACTLTFTAIPLVVTSYPATSTITAGAGDTDITPISNTAVITTAVTDSNPQVTTSKTLISPVPNSFPAAYTYRLVMTGDPLISLPPETQLVWGDRIYASTPPIVIGGPAVVSGITCSTTGFSGGSAAGCPGSYNPPSSAAQWNNDAFFPLGGALPLGLPAGSTVTIDYTVTFPATTCGTGNIFNQFILGSDVNLGLPPPYFQVAKSTSNPLPPSPMGNCTGAAVTVSANKTLLANPGTVVTDTSVRPRYQLVYGVASTTSYPLTVHLGDSTQTEGTGFLEQMNVISCTSTGGLTCPARFNAGNTLMGPQAPNYPPGGRRWEESVVATADGTITLVVEMQYSALTLACMPKVFEQINGSYTHVGRLGDPLPPGVQIIPYQGANFVVSRQQPTPNVGFVTLDFNLPRCVDVAVNKTISLPSPAVGVPFTFNLDYVNISNATVGQNTAVDVPVTDVLGSQFNPTAAVCSVVSGVATAPTASLANISGANNTFSTTIPSLGPNAVVRCAITGIVNAIGSFSNVVTTPATWGPTGRAGMFDVAAGNNSSEQGYGISGAATVAITKVLGTNAGQAAAGTTFPVTATCTVTPRPTGTPSQVIIGPINFVPGTPQTLQLPPETSAQTVSCTLTEGTPSLPPTAPYVYLAPVFSPSATFAVGTSGQPAAPVTLTNNLALPPGSLSITKSIIGGPVGGISAGSFTFSVACGPASPVIPNQTITFGPAASTSQSLTTPIVVPAGDQCTVTELTQPSPPAGFTYAPIPAQQTTPAMPTGGQQTVTVANTLLAPGQLQIEKVVVGAPVGGVSGSFTFSVTCSAGGPYANQTVTLTNASNGMLVAPLAVPVGATCSVQELTQAAAPSGFTWSAIPAATTTPAMSSAGLTATVTNNLSPTAGSLSITKAISGGPVGGISSGSFTFSVACGPASPAIPNQTITFGPAASTSQSLTTPISVPAGDQCTVTELTQPTPPAGFTYGPIPAAQTTTAMPAGGTQTVTINNTLLAPGQLQIEKVVVGAPVGGVSGSFTFSVTCSAGGPYANQTVTLTNASNGMLVAPLAVPVGATCSVQELTQSAPPSGFTWSAIPAATTTPAMSAAGLTAQVTNTLLAPGQLQIEKVVVGAPAGGISGSFTFSVTCSAGGPYVNQTITLTNATSAMLATPLAVPLGATCSVQELTQSAPPSGFTWNAIPAATITPAMPSTGGLTARVTNTLVTNVPAPAATPVPLTNRIALAVLALLLVLTAAMSGMRFGGRSKSQ